ncbi:MAG: type II secretion system F family protein [Solirubrobacterales bacterium]|nr:type II secretion system F family protein [Solirubrobacterales bacterium]
MSALLAGGCAVLVVAALWELIGERGEEAGTRLRRRLSATSTRSVGVVALAPFVAEIQRRIERAALERGLSPAAVLAAKLAGGIISLPLALAAAPVAPGRTGYLVLVGVPVAAFLVPDLLLERAARSRRRRIGAALPDALDLMATGAASGRSAGAMMAEAMRSSSGPLRDELARAVAAIECGSSQEQALRTLRERSRGDNLGSLATALERSRRHGSPLSRALHEQAGSLRGDQRRAIGERAARAAPKMQLVVALLLVPSVLLMVAAAILANSGSLLPSF